jgi:hypothetical protein
MLPETTIIKYATVQFTPDKLVEFGSKVQSREVLSIPRDDIEKIVLKYGLASERPIIDVLIGSGFLLVGLFISIPLLFSYFSELSQGTSVRPAGAKFVGFGLMFIPFAIMFFYLALRKRYYFYVQLRKDKRKIVFHGEVYPVHIRSFIREANSKLGWQIRIDKSVSL